MNPNNSEQIQHLKECHPAIERLIVKSFNAPKPEPKKVEVGNPNPKFRVDSPWMPPATMILTALFNDVPELIPQHEIAGWKMKEITAKNFDFMFNVLKTFMKNIDWVGKDLDLNSVKLKDIVYVKSLEESAYQIFQNDTFGFDVDITIFYSHLEIRT